MAGPKHLKSTILCGSYLVWKQDLQVQLIKGKVDKMESDIQPAKQRKLVDFFINFPLVRIFVFEFIGTAFLLFMVLCIDTLPPIEGHPIVENAYKMVYVVLIVIAAVAFISPFTGSQINPAVTFGLYLPVWRTHYKTILTYWAAQYSGAIVGVILNRNIIGNGGPIFKEAPDFLSLTKMGVEQMTGAFLLVFMVHVLVTKQTTFTHQLGQEHIMIVIVYYLCLSISHTLHCMNPAVIAALQLESMLEGGTPADGLPAAFVIIVFELLGALFASVAFRRVYLPLLLGWRKDCGQM